MQADQIIVRGTGEVTLPPLLAADLAAMRLRAEAVEDQQLKTDLFRLLAVAEIKQKDNVPCL